jgi:hypothetical protein
MSELKETMSTGEDYALDSKHQEQWHAAAQGGGAFRLEVWFGAVLHYANTR